MEEKLEFGNYNFYIDNTFKKPIFLITNIFVCSNLIFVIQEYIF